MNEQIQSILSMGEPIAAFQVGMCALFRRLEKALQEEVSVDLVVEYDDLMMHQEGSVRLVVPDRLAELRTDSGLVADRRPRLVLGQYTTSGLDGLRFRTVTANGEAKLSSLAIDLAQFEISLLHSLRQAHVAAWLVRVKQTAPARVVGAAPVVTPEVDGSTPSDE